MTLELDEKETNLILESLGEMPAKKSMELIIKLRMIWHEQEELKHESSSIHVDENN